MQVFNVIAVRRLAGVELRPLKSYFKVTGWAVLVLIILHPSLLVLELWRDGEGLPPESYAGYVGSAMTWATTLGTFALLLFLSYEAKRWIDRKSWWPVIEYGQIVAMAAIVVHSLALGSNLQSGWFRTVWIGYAVALAISIVIIQGVDIARVKKGEQMKKVVAIVVVAVLVGLIGWFAYQKNQERNEPDTFTTGDSAAEQIDNGDVAPEPGQNNTYTFVEVAEHNTADDCWTTINGSVYDITPYISRHPGGSEIERACGEDGTSLFESRTTESGEQVGSGTPHSSSAASQLEQFKIGTLAN